METRDLALAAALIANGDTLEAVVSEGSHAVFRFTDTVDLRRTVEQFYSRRLSVDAATFGEAIRSAKAAAMAARQKPEPVGAWGSETRPAGHGALGRNDEVHDGRRLRS